MRARIVSGVASVLFSVFSGLAVPPAVGDDGAPAVVRAETKKVCMVTNQLFDRDQIPIKVEDRTYFGCCEMCKERLAKDAAVRKAVDPVSGKEVDKAKAVIGARKDGSVVYFENEGNLKKYNQENGGD